MDYRDLKKYSGTGEIMIAVEYYLENTGIDRLHRERKFPYNWTNYKEHGFAGIEGRDMPHESLLPRSPLDALEYFINTEDTFPPTYTWRYQEMIELLRALEEDEDAKAALAAETTYACVTVHVQKLGEFEQKYSDNGEEVFPLEPALCFDSYKDYRNAFVPMGDYRYIFENGTGHIWWEEADGREAYKEIL